jgi:hypothetical protein
MKLISLFKFLEKEKGKPIPFEVKILHGLPLTPEELDVKGDLDLSDTKIKYLPKGLKIEHFLVISDTKITSLPPDLEVRGHIFMSDTKITSLPPDLKVEGNVWMFGTPLAKKSDKEIRAMLTTGYIKGNIKR